MKRKLSLLMVLMMVLSLVPTMNASALGYDIKFSKIAEDMVLKASEADGRGSWTGGDVQLTNGVWAPAYDRNDAPTLLIDFPETKIGSGDYDITTPGKFSVTVDPDVASFLPGYNYNGTVDRYVNPIVYPADSKGIMVRRVSPYTIEVEVVPADIPAIPDGNGRGHKYVEIPFFIQAQGYGDVMASFETHLMKGFPAVKTTKIATIHRNASTAMVEKVGNLSRNNDIVETSTEYGRIKIVENTIGAWRRAGQKTIEIRLDHPDFSFLEARTNARLWNVIVPGAVTFVKDDNNRSILVHLDVLVGHSEYKASARNQVVLDLPIRVARGAEVGTDVVVSLNGEVSPLTLVLAKYTDYAITLKAEKVLDVIAGQDIQNKYIAKVIIEETVPGSLLDGRVLNVALTGVEKDKDGKEVSKDGRAAYQYDGVVKLERLRGTGDLNIVGSDISSSNAGLTKSARVDKDVDGYEDFDVEVNRGSNLPDNLKDSSKTINRAMKWELSVPFVVRADYVGDLNLTFDGAGVTKQNVKIATVKAPVTFEIAKTDGGKLADLLIGKQAQEAPDVTMKEVEAGVLQVHDIIRKPKDTNKYGILGTGTKKSDVLTWGGAIVDGKFTRVEGDADIEGTSGRSAVSERLFWLKKKSTKASTFKLENVKVTLDRTVPYGPYQIYVDAGNVKARHKSLTDYIATPDYFNVVTPYPEDKDVKTVFTIGEQKYVQTISGIETEVTMDVAAMISENRTMLPVRYVAEALGAKVNYDKDTRVATFTKDNAVVSLNIDSDVLYANGSPVKLLAKPMNENGRILLPLVSIAQAFGLTNGNTEDGVNNDIEWDAAAKTVTLFATKK